MIHRQGKGRELKYVALNGPGLDTLRGIVAMLPLSTLFIASAINIRIEVNCATICQFIPPDNALGFFTHAGSSC